MTAAVYNRYWATAGGGEKYAAGIAHILRRHGEVDLLTHEPFDVDWLAERMAIDLGGCRVRVIDAGTVTDVSGSYDLFVNTSFMSHDRAGTDRSVYVVHFPARLSGPAAGWKRAVLERTGWVHHWIGATFTWDDGFYPRDHGRRAPAWTDGDATIHLTRGKAGELPARLAFGFQASGADRVPEAEIAVDGKTVATVRLDAPRNLAERALGREVAFTVPEGEPGSSATIRIRSAAFTPGAGDDRALGVPIVGFRLGRGAAASAMRLSPALAVDRTGSAQRWLGTYGAVVANSEFTQGWVDRRWGADSEVLYPPVTMFEAGPKAQEILSVGRFFPADRGHSKKQLEMVRAFRQLVDGGLEGWSLHLLGGCAADGETYLASVRAEAAGYPVTIHANATGDELARRYRAAALYWHAAGLGHDPEREPDLQEHFGISTVEAMSAGAVPVVLGSAGLRESVRHGVDGFHFRTLDGLVALSRSLIDDPSRREAMATSAAARARHFDLDAFAARLQHILDGLPER